MNGLNFLEKMYVKALFRDRMADLHGSAFESFFQNVMSLSHDDFVPVRTHGNIGDLSADGLSLHSGKLYACYGPEVFDAKKVEEKFASDLEGAMSKRGGEFTTFVFVHNDTRGLHPKVASLLAQARRDHVPLLFEPLSPSQLRQKVLRLPRGEVEDLFGAEIPVHDVAYGIGLADVKPLLDHLVEKRTPANRQHRPPNLLQVSDQKMEYNRLSEDERETLRLAMMHTYLLDDYYDNVADVTARDDAADGFRAYYQELAEVCTTPDQIVYELGHYVLGNLRADRARERALDVVLAYFFETCDIFDAPPPGWAPALREASMS
ncbi:hypothetical protein Lfu02_36310 [Longispora fulva]|uniref:ABC-three component systems C-terminal domain-containing protein n=1 Tax=Longispora fulva TaxID=619741 RepID=A0A8J7GJH0_9ACTN|nr:ABC-three component system protein [Longispora fulva]MBG6141588.1 hypothetical protein [Longispora fulva]GIG59259.1 hypothetical protein Lfu02_36310 [Longispora fulva]